MSKATLSLLAASLVLAATSAWFARELAHERAKHRAVAGMESAGVPKTSATQVVAGSPAPVATSSDPSLPPNAAVFWATEPGPGTQGVAGFPTPEFDGSSPGWAAMQRVRSSVERAYAKRVYADFVTEEGLSPDESSRLFDVLADDDYANLLMSLSGEHTGGLSPDWESATEARLAKQLGEERMSRLRAFVEARPGRDKVSQLAEQLEGRDLPLSVDQRRRLLRAVIREREHFRKPSPTGALNPASWRELGEYELAAIDRLQAISQPILSPEQIQAVTDLRDAMNEAQRPLVN
jgi:hypothetical protein